MAEQGEAEGSFAAEGSKMTDEQLTEYQKLMGDVERREQERIEQLANEIKEKCSTELTTKMKDITKDYNIHFENRMQGVLPLNICVTASINDNNLLKISRQLTNDWQKLGNILGVEEEEIAEIKENEQGYQAAFKLLWSWRETAREAGTDHEASDQLAAALKKLGKKDLAAMVEGSEAPATTA